MSREHERLAEADAGRRRWRRWGPYVSERQWGTVREDLSPGGAAWEYFPHDHARSRAYQRGEDGLAGICDDRQFLCFALALHNGVDPILKERLFGLTNSEGNHGEDVKELYYYLDSTPTHSYMRYLYKYPQAPFPYGDLVGTNARRSRLEPEYELLRHRRLRRGPLLRRRGGVREGRARGSSLIRITATNRGPEAAPLVVLPTLWFRNRWNRAPGHGGRATPRPILCRGSAAATHRRPSTIASASASFAAIAKPRPSSSATTRRIPGASSARRTPGATRRTPFDDYVVRGRTSAVNPDAGGHQGRLPGAPDARARRVARRSAFGSSRETTRDSCPARISTHDPRRDPPWRGRRLLCGDHRAGPSTPRRSAWLSPGHGGHALVEAVLHLRRLGLARAARPASPSYA